MIELYIFVCVIVFIALVFVVSVISYLIHIKRIIERLDSYVVKRLRNNSDEVNNLNSNVEDYARSNCRMFNTINIDYKVIVAKISEVMDKLNIMDTKNTLTSSICGCEDTKSIPNTTKTRKRTTKPKTAKKSSAERTKSDSEL